MHHGENGMAKKRKCRPRKKDGNKRICVHVPPEERAEMAKFIPDHNWSAIACKAWRDAVEEMKRLRAMRDGKL